MYLAQTNVPGYLPTDDDPAEFETAKEAWGYLAWQRRAEEDEADMTPNASPTYSETMDTLVVLSQGLYNPHVALDGCGSVVGPTPGYDGTHDQGMAYSVSWVDGPR